MLEACVLNWSVLSSGRDGEKLTKILKRRHQGGRGETRRTCLLEVIFKEDAYCIFSFLCLVHTHDLSWSNWSTFRALTRIIKNKKHALFCLMVLSWSY